MLDLEGENVLDLISLIATLALLGVTAWYAKTTKDMAVIAGKAAQDSVKATAAAERSAEASLDAARVAQSQIRPEFEVSAMPVMSLERPKSEPCLRITSVGDAVVVQRVRVQRAIREFFVQDRENLSGIVYDLAMSPHDSADLLPKRLHLSESVFVTHPILQDQIGSNRFVRFMVEIDYTFSETGGAGATRKITVENDSARQV